MERPSSNSPPPPVRRSQRSTAGRPANKYGDWDTRSSSSSSMSTRERRLAEASRQKQAADNELRRKELAILRMELELERNINECEHQDQLAKIEQDERADFLLAQPLTSDLNERIQQWIVEESTSAAPTPTATEVRSNSNPVAVNFGSTQTTHVSADRPPHLPITASARDQPGAQQEIAPANGQVLESTPRTRTVDAASAQLTELEEVSQTTLPHLPSIDSHIPPPHSAPNSSFALPSARQDLHSSFALPPVHSAQNSSFALPPRTFEFTPKYTRTDLITLWACFAHALIKLIAVVVMYSVSCPV